MGICFNISSNLLVYVATYVYILFLNVVASTRASITWTPSTKPKTEYFETTSTYWTPILTPLTDNNARTLVTSTQLTTISTTPHSTPDGNQRHSLATDTTTEQASLATTQSTVTSQETSTQRALSQGTTLFHSVR